MMQEYLIEPCGGISIEVYKGQTISIIDAEGGQVVDFFAEILGDDNEFLSTGVTIDCNNSLKLSVGDYIFTNLYRPMFQIIKDDVCKHDLIHPCCRKEMYEYFYRNGKGHPNCLDNINRRLNSSRPIINPVNFFMNTEIMQDGKIIVRKPVSKSGDKIVLSALINVKVGIAACSVSESDCNSHKCSSVKIIVDK